MVTLSIVIPLAPEERAWNGLVAGLRKGLAEQPEEVELLFVVSEVYNEDSSLQLPSMLAGKKVRIINSKPGRANHLNAGAEAATGEHLWFLHADSILKSNTLAVLCGSISKHPESLLFFDLAFLDDATCLTRLNAWGARFRSRTLKVPFGDQGLCIKKAHFNRLGGFPVGLTYGEDHLFVWRARRQGINIRATGGTLYTSARKYKMNGWLSTTLNHQYLWVKQAWPEWKKMKKIKEEHLG